MRLVMLDTSAIYALVVKDGQRHEAAVRYASEASHRGIRFVLADVVFLETMNLLRKRLGTLASIQIGRHMRRSSAYLWEPVTAAGERAAWEFFEHHDDKAWSLTDCCILAVAHRMHVGEVFSFDSHFDQMPGLLRVPGRASD